MKAILFWLLITTGLLPAFYVSPAEGVLLFRRDTLSLDDNRQKLLSKDFLALASRPNALQNSHQSRATAQLLALAANLDPDSKSASNLSRMFADTQEETTLKSFDLEETVMNITKTARYLLQDSENKNHTAIAQIFLDPLAIITPELAMVSARPNAEESPRWHRVVAPVEYFMNRRDDTPPAPEEGIAMNEEEGGDEVDENKKPLLQVPDFEGSIQVPVFLRERSGINTLTTYPRLVALAFEAKLSEGPSKITPPVADRSRTLPEVISRMQANLGQSYDSQTVSRIDGSFRLGKANYIDRNGHTLTLPMTILAEGLLSERKPLANLVVLGDLLATGEIRAPKNSWQFLEILLASKSNQTRRLLLPPDLRPFLEALLTQQKEDFFFDYDVLEIRNLADAYELAFEGAAPEQTVAALANFQEIRRVGEGKTTSVFVANSHVLNRLVEVKKIEPRHLSATLLQMRGSGDQPAKYPTEILASMVQTALMPMAKLPYASSRDLKATDLERIHDECRANLDPLARNVSIGDRKLYDEAVDLANRIRTLARAKARYDKEEYTGEESFHVSLFFSTFKAIQKDFYALALKTVAILGQEPPLDPSLIKN